MCNLSSMTMSQEARRLFDGLIDRAGDMPPWPGICLDHNADHRQLSGRSRTGHGSLGHADSAADQASA
ncbi:MAG: hypothetical protein KDJ81_01145 [Rhodobacteraceae bacterium]|nr:hypothetical protein [Paracoccaceae bacterium]